MKINTKQIYIILLMSIFFSFIRYLFLDESFSLIKKTKLESLDIVIENDDSSDLKMMIQKITSPALIDIDLAKSLFNSQLVTFIDARDVDSYNESHILNSINIPYDLIEDINNKYDLTFSIETMNDFEEEIIIDNNNPIYLGMKNGDLFIANNQIDIIDKYKYTTFLIYCSGAGCTLSEDLAFYMHDQLRFSKIFIYEGGIPEWIDYGYPTKQ